MTDFSTRASELLRYSHSGNDLVTAKEAMVMALRQLNGRRVEWGEGSATFTLEPNVAEYPIGSYPRLPGGIKSFSSKPLVGISPLAGSVLQPDTLVSSTNLQLAGGGAATIAPLQDSAQQPDDADLQPASAANTGFTVRWDVALTRPLIPGTREGAGRQIMRVAMFNEGTARAVTWEVFEGATSIATGSWTVNSSSRSVYEAKWDASKLSTLNPAANQITLAVSDATGNGDVHYSAVQWFTATRDEQLTLSSGQLEMSVVPISVVRRNLSGRIEVISAVPDQIAFFDDRLFFYPTPASAYLCTFDYQLDSTRDETTNAEITTSSTTETNPWFTKGWSELLTEALQIYYSLRSHDAKATQLAAVTAQQAKQAQDLNYATKVFNSPVKGIL